MEDVRQRRVTLYTCFILFIVGSAVILWANSNYNSIFWKRRLIYPSQGITFETDTSTQFSAISWFIYTSNEQTAESKWKTVQLDLDPLFRSSPQFNLTVIVPNKAYLDESQMTIFSFVENCLYDEIYESTTIKINFETPRLTFCFNWEILSQESYDRYQIYMLLYPKFINCTSEEYTVKVYNLPKATIDLSRTFPHPTSSHCHPPEYPTYHWRLTNVQDVAEEVSPTMLQISFVFPEKTSQKERIVFESGVLFGFGTAFILNGLVRIFLLIGTEWVQVKGYIMHRGKLLVLIIFVLFVALISVLSYCFPS